MGRLALRPGLRAYAHAPAVSAEEAWANAVSLDFDGTDDHCVSASVIPVSVLSGPISMSCWVDLGASRH